MKTFITFIAGILFITINAYCDTVPGRFERQKMEFRTDSSEIKPDEEHLFETKGYNQALVSVGFIAVLGVVGGFAYLLTKKKH